VTIATTNTSNKLLASDLSIKYKCCYYEAILTDHITGLARTSVSYGIKNEKNMVISSLALACNGSQLQSIAN